MKALNDMCKWIKEENGEVGVYDATNSTHSRRCLVDQVVCKENGLKLFFVESICDDEELIKLNIRVSLP